MPPRQSIQFEGGPVPPFLARLQAQIQGSSSSTSDRHFDPLLEARRKAKRDEVEERKKNRAESGRATANGDEDEDDEFDGAQVVVLDEGKDLSREQALGRKVASQTADGKGSAERPQPSSETIATPGAKRKAEDQAGPSSSSKQPKGFDALAEEVAKHKKAPGTAGQKEKEKERKDKNKRAAKEKKKAGKGLSFDI
ncbi:unnamed protein product [Tilletia controversa]|nr:unnamed protein product [Tilletia controversa]